MGRKRRALTALPVVGSAELGAYRVTQPNLASIIYHRYHRYISSSQNQHAETGGRRITARKTGADSKKG